MDATTPRDGRHDFDFLHGRWQVQNERLGQRLAGSAEWAVFMAEDECRPLLDGLANLEEFHAAWDGGFEGLALRLYDVAAGEWRIHWSSNRTGVLDIEKLLLANLPAASRLRKAPPDKDKWA